MKSFGKGLFWLGFILLMGVVIAYLIIMLAGIMAFASWTTAVSFCVLILLGGLFMLIGRSSERKGEMKAQRKELELKEKENSATDTSKSTGLTENV